MESDTLGPGESETCGPKGKKAGFQFTGIITRFFPGICPWVTCGQACQGGRGKDTGREGAGPGLRLMEAVSGVKA